MYLKLRCFDLLFWQEICTFHRVLFATFLTSRHFKIEYHRIRNFLIPALHLILFYRKSRSGKYEKIILFAH